MVFCDREGQVYDHPVLAMAAANGPAWRAVRAEETIPLPEGSTLVAMPGRLASGWDLEREVFDVVASVKGVGQISPAAAVLPPAYLRTLLPAQRPTKRAEALPLLGYTAVGWGEDGFRVPALRLDERTHWDPEHFDTPDLPARIAAKRERLGGNRILAQLARCATDYHCYTAQNFFYERGEAGLPISPACNAQCIGCISQQPAGCCPSPQERIDFEPTTDEAAAVAIEHLSRTGQDAIISFGQCCEGEPLLRADAIAEVARRVRAEVPGGTININTNGSRPDAIAALADAGVDSLRISLASAMEARYAAYHRPQGYDLSAVCETIDRAGQAGLRRAANLLVFPGVTDTDEEIAALIQLLAENPVDTVQMRNLNLDPDDALDVLDPRGAGVGVPDLLERLRAAFPDVPLASFNAPLETGPDR
jgi:pyruvate-formate lyase-activating enzyme